MQYIIIVIIYTDLNNKKNNFIAYQLKYKHIAYNVYIEFCF